MIGEEENERKDDDEDGKVRKRRKAVRIIRVSTRAYKMAIDTLTLSRKRQTFEHPHVLPSFAYFSFIQIYFPLKFLLWGKTTISIWLSQSAIWLLWDRWGTLVRFPLVGQQLELSHAKTPGDFFVVFFSQKVSFFFLTLNFLLNYIDLPSDFSLSSFLTCAPFNSAVTSIFVNFQFLLSLYCQFAFIFWKLVFAFFPEVSALTDPIPLLCAPPPSPSFNLKLFLKFVQLFQVAFSGLLFLCSVAVTIIHFESRTTFECFFKRFLSNMCTHTIGKKAGKSNRRFCLNVSKAPEWRIFSLKTNL